MKPDHDWEGIGSMVCGGPDIEKQTVFASVELSARIDRGFRREPLPTGWTELGCRPDTVPRRGRLGRTPPGFPDRRFGIVHPSKYERVVCRVNKTTLEDAQRSRDDRGQGVLDLLGGCVSRSATRHAHAQAECQHDRSDTHHRSL